MKLRFKTTNIVIRIHRQFKMSFERCGPKLAFIDIGPVCIMIDATEPMTVGQRGVW